MSLSRAPRPALLLTLAALSLIAHAKGWRAPLLDYHFHRQVNTASIARNYGREARPPHRPRVDWEGPEDRLAATELPVLMWLHGRLWPLLDLGEAWGRLISIAASALTALLLFLLLEAELGRAAAFSGAALFCVLPLEVYFGRTVQPEAGALLGLAAALYFWRRSLGPGRPAWAAAAAAGGLFLSSGLKLPYAHALIPLAGLSLRALGPAAWRDARSWLWPAAAFSGVLAWYLWARTGVYVVPAHPGEFLVLLRYRSLPYFAQFLVFSRFLELIVTYAGLPLFLAGARELLWRRRDPFWLAWLGGTFLHLLALGHYGHSHDYTALPLALPAAGLMGEGFRLLLEKARARQGAARSLALAGLCALALGVPAHAALRIRHWYRQGWEFTARAAEAARAVSAREDLFLTSGPAPSVLLYYLDRRGWSDDLAARTPEAARDMLEARRRAGARFLAAEKKGAFAEPGGALWKALRESAAPVWDDGALVIFPLREPS